MTTRHPQSTLPAHLSPASNSVTFTFERQPGETVCHWRARKRWLMQFLRSIEASPALTCWQ